MENSNNTYIIGEVGQNHNGSVDIAKQIIDTVAKDIYDNKHRLESSAMKLELNDEGMFVIYI